MLEEFKRLTADLPYRPGSIFPSEMFLFYREAKACNADHIIESGVGHGGSTRYLARLFPDVRITSVDKNDGHPGLTEFLRGDATHLLPQIVEESKGKRIAVLIDGPKGKKQTDLAEVLLELEKVVLLALHDFDWIAGIRSRDESFRREFGHLDANVGEYLKHYPNGPGLTIFK